MKRRWPIARYCPACVCRSGGAGGPVQEIRPGDVVWFAPGERHWHGAAPQTAMSHIAIQEVQDGRAVDWAEPVEDADYAAPAAP